MLGAQTVADVGSAALEVDVLVNEVPVDPVMLDNIAGDVVKDGQIGLGREHDRQVGQIEAAVLKGGEHCHLDIGCAQPAIGHPSPENRVHLCHVGTPQHERISAFHVVVAAHGLVHAEGAHEPRRRRSHAVPGVGVDVVGAETGLIELCGGIALPHRPLARAEHTDGRGSLFPQSLLELLLHDVEGAVPTDGSEIAAFVESSVLHAQQWCR